MSPSPSHIWFVLLEDTGVYLDIPLSVLKTLCKYPAKFLRWLAWAILHVDGSLQHGEKTVSDEDEIIAGRIYVFRAVDDDDGIVLAQEFHGKPESDNLSHTSDDPNNPFHIALKKRDVCCVFTGCPSQAVPIVDLERGDQWWLDAVIQALTTKQRHGENVHSVGLDDPRNGMLLDRNLRGVLDLQLAAIVVTPNHVLDMADIPDGEDRPLNVDSVMWRSKVYFPDDVRYTIQMLAPLKTGVPHNGRAAFVPDSGVPLPSPLLLEFAYGLTALRLWGHGAQLPIEHPKYRFVPVTPEPADGGSALGKRPRSEDDPSESAGCSPESPVKHRRLTEDSCRSVIETYGVGRPEYQLRNAKVKQDRVSVWASEIVPHTSGTESYESDDGSDTLSGAEW
ncbi:hypothetical protein FA95DRAFT_1606808 [Auriscalpium vulgare]|uniref:Uncharacterized protein n=1 Tax=Auriscalpium vulgare TaxID=40419 RepID=A0ACB8RSQ2_9AGAM|nr:hypothetical protein FA95DRAFT_1606808 [Auriscalpium vulgare]